MAERLTIQKVLLVVDGTENGIRAARYAVRFAAAHKAKLTGVAVVDTAILKSLLKSSVLVETEMEEFDRELETSAQTNLNYVGQLAKEAGVSVDLTLKKGAAHAVVCECARDMEPDVLVMGSFSTSMIKRDVNARARRLIVDEARCPIVLVP